MKSGVDGGAGSLDALVRKFTQGSSILLTVWPGHRYHAKLVHRKKGVYNQFVLAALPGVATFLRRLLR